MSIPLDKLYHYIESIAQDILRDNVLIYRFFPHGSKKLDDLQLLRNHPHELYESYPMLCCNDQEPVNYDLYEGICDQTRSPFQQLVADHDAELATIFNSNLKKNSTIFDDVILLHSEKRSSNVIKYQNNNFIPVYYWSHAIIARDWFRYAEYDKVTKNVTSTFLIYNRAWSGTREYRIKFVDLLITYELLDDCQISFNNVEPETNVHYTSHKYTNLNFSPVCDLEKYIKPKEISSSASADYDIDDYNSTEFEVVLETLFDDERLHLTEKILRPIAIGQPFLLAATHGSLEYLRSYGFKTFSSIIDETYDTIEDPRERLEAIVKSMKDITSWGEQERKEKMLIASQIVEHNRKHFFSDEFSSQIANELKTNLTAGLTQLISTNTSERFFDFRKKLAKHKPVRDRMLSDRSRKNIAKVVYTARQYYLKKYSAK